MAPAQQFAPKMLYMKVISSKSTPKRALAAVLAQKAAPMMLFSSINQLSHKKIRLILRQPYFVFVCGRGLFDSDGFAIYFVAYIAADELAVFGIVVGAHGIECDRAHTGIFAVVPCVDVSAEHDIYMPIVEEAEHVIEFLTRQCG